MVSPLSAARCVGFVDRMSCSDAAGRTFARRIVHGIPELFSAR
jgi:hypothetical protein